jgi:lysophospholipase L1-like esterase
LYEGARESGFRVVEVTIYPFNTATPDHNAWMHLVNDWIRRQAAADPAIAVVDTRAAVAAPGNPDRLSETADQLHPSPAGYRAMADAIRPVIERLLR